MAKRILAIVLSIVMCFSMLQLHVFAAGNDQVMDGYYILDEQGNITGTTDAESNSANGFTLSKKIAQTGLNQFNITLKVVTSQEVTTSNAAIQLVIDTSISMEDCAEGCGSNCRNRSHSTRLEAVKDILTKNNGFLDSLIASNSGKIFVSVIRFGQTAKTVCDWVDIKDPNGLATVKSKINGLGNLEYATNMHAGLLLARNRWGMSEVANTAAKFTVLLSDGAANCTGRESDSTTSIALGENHATGSTGNEKCRQAAENVATVLNGMSSVYAVGYGVEKDYLNSIINNESHVFVGAGTSDVSGAFANIAQSAVNGMNGAGSTVTDPMGEFIVMGNVSGLSGDGVSSANGTLTWKLDPSKAQTSVSGSVTTYTYEITYPITLNTAGDGFQEKNDDGSTKYYPTNGYTYLSVPADNGTVEIPFNIPAVCGELPIFSVSYEYTGTVPAGAPAVPSSADYKKGSTVTVADEPSLANYTFSGWTTSDASVADGTFQMPGNNVTLVGSWTEHPKYNYTLTYDGNGGALANSDVAYNDAQSIAAPGTYATSHTFDVDANSFVRENFTFVGWSTEPNGEVISDEQIVLTFDNNTEVLYAQWEAIPYTVTYEYTGTVPAGAPALPADATQFAGDVVTVAENPTLEHYTFSGWTTSDASVADGTFQMPGNNVTLVGSWTEQPKYSYTLIYDGNGGALANSDVAYNDAQSIAAPGTYATSHTFDVDANSFVRENFTFVGWSTEPNGEVISDEQIVLTFDNNTEVLYAQWEAIPYTVTYEYTGTVPAGAPALPADATQFAGDVVTVAENPTLEHYTFSGWTTSDASVADGTFQMPGNNVTLVGSWTEHPKYSYTLIYDGNGGALANSDVAYNDAQSIAAPGTYATSHTFDVDANSFERENFTFVGWSTEPNGEVISDEQIVLTFDNNTEVLYAQWEAIPYTVTYEYTGTVPAGAPALPADATQFAGDVVTVAENPTLEHYTFSGWTTSDASVADGIFQMPGNNVTLVGSWTEHPKYDYSVIYNANFGTDPETKADSENVVATYATSYTINVDANSFERANYTFVGWASTPDGEVEFNADDAILFNNGGSKTLYAQWIEHDKYSYTVIYNGNGGELENGNQAYGDAENVVGTYATTHEVEVDDNTFIRENYTFAGWNTKADGSGTAYTAEDVIALSAEDNTETLYAQWTINAYEYVVKYMVKLDNAAYAPFSGDLPQSAPTGGSAIYGTVIDEEVLAVPAALTDAQYTYAYVSLDGVQIADGENVITVYYSYTTPEEEVPPTIEIEDEDPPLAEVPKTGDLTVFYYGLAALSGTGLAVLGLTKKKEDDEE